ncbi:MAG: restriction endonuclease subunit S [Candidatus Marinimicrobia bacterium]|jgi:type I restriction enzyme S subunit|nr:restriction endonuclease subunit S [Candidatus Neomarinimicrobiota bacterium]
MSEWREFRLEDFVDIHNQIRIPLSKMERSKKQGIYPYYGASGVIDCVDDYLFDGEFVLVSEDGENLKSRKTPIAFKASGKFWVNNHAHIIKGKKGFHNNLIIYYLQNLDLHEYITGAVQPKLNKANLLSIPLCLPEDENEQKAIAEVLSSLDDKIDLLHSQNKTLEQMAETLFRQWFVEEAQEDWEEGVLDDILTVKGGTTPSTKNPNFWKGKIHWTTPKDLSKNSPLFLMNTLRKITKAGLENISSGLLPKGTLLLSSRAPVGYLAFAEIPLAINQGYIAIIDNKGFSKTFIYLWLRINMDYVKSHANGSTFQEISKTSFKALKIILPPKRLQIRFDETVNDNFKKIRSNLHQVRSLENLRNTLLPKLMSGEIRVASNG